MSKVLAIACFLLASALAYSQGERSHVRVSFNDSLGAIARAKSLTQFGKELEQATKDYPHRAVYAAMYTKLGGPNPDALLISAMPSNLKEWRRSTTRSKQSKAKTWQSQKPMTPFILGLQTR
jgi:hypothetical protein